VQLDLRLYDGEFRRVARHDQHVRPGRGELQCRRTADAG
jgi:hypothetical protein